MPAVSNSDIVKMLCLKVRTKDGRRMIRLVPKEIQTRFVDNQLRVD